MAHKNLWAPWRIDYIRGLDPDRDTTPRADAAPDRPTSGCFLCDMADDALPVEQWSELLLLHRDERGTVLLNRYPYTNGHLLVAPLPHVADLVDFTPPQRHGLMDLIDLGCRVVREVLNPQGMNVGMNLGRCAGAGLPGHAHMHIVPRWNGDTGFTAVLGDVRVVPQSLDESYAAMKTAIDRLA